MLKEGKLFGKISIIDIVIVLAIIICAIGVYVRFVALPQRVQVEHVTFTYQVMVRNIRQPSVDALVQSIGTAFSLGEKGRSDDLGRLVDVSANPSKEPLITKDGNVIMAQMPTKLDALLTFTIDGLENERGYFTKQLKDIGIGGTLLLQNKFIKTEGQVISLQLQ